MSGGADGRDRRQSCRCVVHRRPARGQAGVPPAAVPPTSAACPVWYPRVAAVAHADRASGDCIDRAGPRCAVAVGPRLTRETHGRDAAQGRARRPGQDEVGVLLARDGRTRRDLLPLPAEPAPGTRRTTARASGRGRGRFAYGRLQCVCLVCEEDRHRARSVLGAQQTRVREGRGNRTGTGGPGSGAHRRVVPRRR